MDDRALLAELEPVAGKLYDRHDKTAKEWFPHELVPWSRGRDYEADVPWDPTEHPLPDGVRSALFVNLLTEDNLPYYYATIGRLFDAGEAWKTWSKRWTAEEGRHSTVIRDWMMVTRVLDPVALERGRMQQVSGGVVPEPEAAPACLVYVALQELATRVSHFNTGRKLTDPVGTAIMDRVAVDENFHHLFYRDLTAAAIELDPSTMVIAMEEQVKTFEMPGVGIENFTAHAKAIAAEGIYDFTVHHEKVLTPVVLRNWKLEQITGLDAEAEKARERTLAHIARVERVGRRMAERREEVGAGQR